jgi:hypothetical protein
MANPERKLHHSEHRLASLPRKPRVTQEEQAAGMVDIDK